MIGLTFLNLAILSGAALAVAPLIVHLLDRRRARDVDWGAMRFLAGCLEKESQRLRIQNLLLLLVRALIIACLALALSRPFLRQSGKQLRASNVRRDVVLVIDDSASMGFRSADGPRIVGGDAPGAVGPTRFDRALELAGRIADTLRDGDSLNVIRGAHTPRALFPAPVTHLKRARQALAELEPSYEPSRMAEAVAEALAQLERGHNPRREVYILSDLQAYGWQAGRESLWRAAARTAERIHTGVNLFALQVRRKTPASTVTLVQSSQIAGQRPKKRDTLPDAEENLAVTTVSLDRRVVGTDRPVRIRAQIANAGADERAGVELTLYVDGVKKSSQSLSIPAGGTRTCTFRHHFIEPGIHTVRVELPRDNLPADDRRWLSLRVIEDLPVLLVAGEPAHGAGVANGAIGAELFLELAMAPRDLDNPRLKMVLKPRRIYLRDLSVADLEDCRVVVLSNCPRPEPGQVQALERFVREGGGLMILPGDRVRPDGYNDALYRGGAGLMPCRLGPAAGRLAGSNASGHQPPRRIAVPGPFAHPALALFNDPGSGNLAAARLFRTFPLEVASHEATRKAGNHPQGGYPVTSPLTPDSRRVTRDAAVEVLARLDSGLPFLVTRRFGLGQVVLAACGADPLWSDLPIRPFFPPLIHQLVNLAASGSGERLTLTVGRRIVHALRVGKPANGSRTPAADAKRPVGTVTITTPDGTTHRLEPDGGTWEVVKNEGNGSASPAKSEIEANRGPEGASPGVNGFTFADTHRPGMYTVRQVTGNGWGDSAFARPGKTPSGGTDVPHVHKTVYAVNMDPRESDLTPLSQEARERLEAHLPLRFAETWNELEELAGSTPRGRELWPLLALAAVALMLIENLLTRHWSGK